MVVLTPEQKKAFEIQKKDCPFCKIIDKTVSAKIPFEDEHIIGILDINPLSKGHTLLMTKEHYPFLTLIPNEDAKRLFLKIKECSIILKNALYKNGLTIFIANGFSAGQSSTHFLIHIIPREENDNINLFKLKQQEINLEEENKIFTIMKNTLPKLMNEYLKTSSNEGIEKKVINYDNYEKKQNKLTEEQVINIINSNEKLKEIILNAPEIFIEESQKKSEFRILEEGMSIDRIIEYFNPGWAINNPEIMLKLKKERRL
jgi:histidine triad (HIT) family protein